jgi:hypothetical protein
MMIEGVELSQDMREELERSQVMGLDASDYQRIPKDMGWRDHVDVKPESPVIEKVHCRILLVNDTSIILLYY